MLFYTCWSKCTPVLTLSNTKNFTPYISICCVQSNDMGVQAVCVCAALLEKEPWWTDHGSAHSALIVEYVHKLPLLENQYRWPELAVVFLEFFDDCAAQTGDAQIGNTIQSGVLMHLPSALSLVMAYSIHGRHHYYLLSTESTPNIFSASA